MPSMRQKLERKLSQRVNDRPGVSARGAPSRSPSLSRRQIISKKSSRAPEHDMRLDSVEREIKHLGSTNITVPVTCDNLRQRVNANTLQEYQVIFDVLDDDQSGSISIQEMESAFRQMGIKANSEQIRHLLHEIDEDDNGELDVEEFSVMLQRLSEGEKLVKHDSPTMESEINDLMSEDRKQTFCPAPVAKLRAAVWSVAGDGGHSWMSTAFIVFVMSLIFVSCAVFIMESMPDFYRVPASMELFIEIEQFCIICFTVEFFLRLFSCPDYGAYCADLLNWVDLVAIMPFYIEKALAGEDIPLGVIRTIRLVRIFRLFKFSRYVTWIGVFAATIIESLMPLAIIIFIMLIVTILVASLVYNVERGIWTCADEGPPAVLCAYRTASGELTTFGSIPESMWWTLVTMTTVGYGVPWVPLTGLGKFIGALTGLAGILILAVPISVISANFQQQYRKMNTRRHLKAEQEAKFQRARQAAIENRMRDAEALAIADSGGEQISPKIRKRASITSSSGVESENQMYLMTCFELNKSNQKKMLGMMKDKESRKRTDLLHEIVSVVHDSGMCDPITEDSNVEPSSKRAQKRRGGVLRPSAQGGVGKTRSLDRKASKEAHNKLWTASAAGNKIHAKARRASMAVKDMMARATSKSTRSIDTDTEAKTAGGGTM